MRKRAMSETISSGGFSSASAYWRSWLKAASRSLVLALILPGEAVAFPDVGPTAAAGVLARAALEAVALAAGVVLCRRRFSQQPAQVYEVFLGGRALVQFRRVPLGYEMLRFHISLQRLAGSCPGQDGIQFRLQFNVKDGAGQSKSCTWREVMDDSPCVLRSPTSKCLKLLCLIGRSTIRKTCLLNVEGNR